MIRDARRVRTTGANSGRGDSRSPSRRLPVPLVLLSIAFSGCGASPAPSADPVHPARLSDADWAQALAGGDFAAVRAELERSPERASIAMAGSYPLHLAAESGNEALIDCLVDAGADPNCRDPLRCTPLYGAAGAGAPKTLRRLIEKGADVDAKDAIGASPLAGAVLSGSLECFEILLDAGASVERVHPIATLLSIAVMADAIELVLPIIEAGIDVDALDLLRHSALHTASTLGRTEVVRILLEAGADTSLRTPLGETPLILAARGLGPTFLQDQLLPLLNMSFAGTRSPSPEGAAPRAAERIVAAIPPGDPPEETLRLLLEHGAEIASKSAVGATALHEAASCGRVDALRILMRHGADLNLRDQSGFTPIHCAAERGHPEAVAALLAAGAEPKAAALDLRTSLHSAAQGGHIAVCEFLIAGGVDVDAEERNGATALVAASIAGHAEVVRTLLRAGADPDAPMQDGACALHTAALFGRVEAVAALLAAGADAEKPDVEGRTPLHFAAAKGQVEIISLLREHGASTKALDRYGATPIDIATRNGDRRTLAALTRTLKGP